MLDERKIVARVLQGDQDAFRVIIRTHQRLVMHVLLKLIPVAEDREELYQDIFLQVHQRLGAFRFQSKLSTWIAQIAYNMSLNYLRKKRIPISWELSDDIFSGKNETYSRGEDEAPDVLLEQEELKSFIQQNIEQLPARYKTILTLYHIEDMSYKEIGQALKMPEGTVKNYLFRARKLLKDSILKAQQNGNFLFE
ncbi:MAG TPA: RNA polymerase subunit sigma-24 [Microscillaceae bacterium]|nr:RNA polymerase subunit sigma-24 [Microscillaceae bacterium]